MRTLQVALRVRDRQASVEFYAALGYEVVGEVADSPIGHLMMLKLAGDEFVSVELVDDPRNRPGGETSLSHLAVQVESLDDVVARLAEAGVSAGPVGSPGPDVRTAHVIDPDGRRIELVQWAPGHAAGLGPDDWPEPEQEEQDR